VFQHLLMVGGAHVYCLGTTDIGHAPYQVYRPPTCKLGMLSQNWEPVSWRPYQLQAQVANIKAP